MQASAAAPTATATAAPSPAPAPAPAAPSPAPAPTATAAATAGGASGGGALTVATDCSGIEAPIVALKQMGVPYRLMWASDISLPAKDSTIANGIVPEQWFDDMSKRDHSTLPKDIGVYICGFPCQPFSKNNSNGQFGFGDGDRGTVFFHCVATIKAVRPRLVVLENVKNILHHDKGNTFKVIKNELSGIQGYKWHHGVLNTMDFGIPQKRVRLFIVGCLDGEPSLPVATHTDPAPLCQFLNDNIPNGTKTLTQHQQGLASNWGAIPNFDTVVRINGSNSFLQGTKPSSKCPTIDSGQFYLPHRKRMMDISEALALQGFPSTFKLNGNKSEQRLLVGNSISVPVLIAIFAVNVSPSAAAPAPSAPAPTGNLNGFVVSDDDDDL